MTAACTGLSIAVPIALMIVTTPKAKPALFANQFVTRMGAETMKKKPPVRPMTTPDAYHCQSSVYVPISASAPMHTKNEPVSMKGVFSLSHSLPT